MKLDTKVIVTQPIHPEGMKLLEENIAEVVVSPSDDKKAVLELLDDRVEGVVVRYNIFDKDMINAAKNLKVIARHGIGVELIDVDAASNKNIIVVNTPDAATNSVAEHVIMMVLMLAKKVQFASSQLADGNYSVKNQYNPSDVMGKTIGFIGLGRIGLLAAEKCHCLGMNVVAYDPYVTKGSIPCFVELKKDIEAVLSCSDFVSLHTPLTEETRKMIGEEELLRMKDSAYLINCARGAILDETALIESLENKVIAGAGLDVFLDEPPHPKNPLLFMDNVVVTPHSSALTEDGKIRMAVGAAQQLIDILRGKAPKFSVN